MSEPTPTPDPLDEPTLVHGPPRSPSGASPEEATVILIAHPDNKGLGSRHRLQRGGSLLIGRAADADVPLPDVPSVSRHHAMLTFEGRGTALEDLGSTNGTWINDRRVSERSLLQSGDRFSVGAVCFKLLLEQDVEHAYHLAVHEMVIRDGLTAVFNRRKFDDEARREWARARRYGRPLSLLLFDFDHFKGFNDEHGHLVGDRVLQQTLGAVASIVRDEHTLARVGGEEFAILCPEAQAENARVLAERLREQVEQREHVEGSKRMRVTVTVGVAELEPHMQAFSELYEAADRALYAGKGAGRNRVAVAPVAPPGGTGGAPSPPAAG